MYKERSEGKLNMKNYKFRVKDIKTIDKELCKFMKVCNKCNKLELLINFGKANRCKDGRRNICKQCKWEESKLRYKHICEYCNKEFKSSNKEQKFCSVECWSKSTNNSLKKDKKKDNLSCKKILVKCDYCGKDYSKEQSRVSISKHHFCSRECMGKFKANRIDIICDQCGKKFKQTPYKIKQSINHFCTKECAVNFQKNRTIIKCDYCGEEIEVKNRNLKLYDHHFCNKECYDKWKSINLIGENSPSWDSTKTQEEREIGRCINGYSNFIKTVYERDNYTCQVTGKRGGDLVVHHLNGYHWDKEHRTDINNGITLSKEIHKLFHKIYGQKNNTKEQFEEFVIRYNNGEFKEILDK